MRNSEPNRAGIECQDCALGKALGRPCALRIRTMRAGQRLWDQGVPREQAVHVKEGLVGLSHTGRDGRPGAYILRGPGSVLGLEGLVEETTTFGAQALTDGLYCALPIKELHAQAAARPAFSGELLQRAAAELAALLRERWESAGTALARVTGFLLRRGPVDPLAEGLGKAGLARALGMSPETLSRVLRRLKSEHLITDSLTVLDEPGLRRLLDTDSW